LESNNVTSPAVPFVSAFELAIHFAKHGAKFGAATPADYEALADAFLTGPMNATTDDCTRPNLVDYLRFDSSNRHFGLLCLRTTASEPFIPLSLLWLLVGVDRQLFSPLNALGLCK
jgi:hypothetical protein